MVDNRFIDEWRPREAGALTDAAKGAPSNSRYLMIRQSGPYLRRIDAG